MTIVSIRPSTRRLGMLFALVVAGLLISPDRLCAQVSKEKTAAAEKKKNTEQLDSAETGDLPKFADLQKVVGAHFKKQKKTGYRNGDIISQSDAQAVLAKLKKAGWEAEDGDAIVKQTLPDSHYLVKQLRSKKGRGFMRGITRYKGGYDRAEKLLKLPNGRNFFNGLLKGRDGYKMIEYMTTTKGGRNLGKQIGNAPKNKNFNKPTGHIYTEKQLTARLKQSYADQQKKAKAPAASKKSKRPYDA